MSKIYQEVEVAQMVENILWDAAEQMGFSEEFLDFFEHLSNQSPFNSGEFSKYFEGLQSMIEEQTA